MAAESCILILVVGIIPDALAIGGNVKLTLPGLAISGTAGAVATIIGVLCLLSPV